MLDTLITLLLQVGSELDKIKIMTDMGDPTSTIALTVLIKMMAMSGFAAVAHALNQYRTGGTKKMTDITILGFIAFFFGIVSGLLVYKIVGGENTTFYGLIGVSGWLGVEMSSVLTKFISNKFK